jgi:hypothetical protein
MHQITEERATLLRVRNEYETHMYRIRRSLDHDEVFLGVTTEAERKRIGDAVDKHEAWFDSAEAKRAPRAIVQAQFDQLKKLTGFAQFRAAELTKRPEAFQRLNETLAIIAKAVHEVWPREKHWLEGALVKDVQNCYDEAAKFLEDSSKKQARLEATDDPAVSSDEIEKRRQRLQSCFEKVDSITEPTASPTPSPTPTSRPRPNEAPTPADVDRPVDDKRLEFNEL